LTIYLHDSGRAGRLSWLVDAVMGGVASGIVLNAFETPASSMPRRPSAARTIAELEDAGASVILDPATHATLAPGTDKFAVYNTWSFWPDGERSLATSARLRVHVETVVAAQQRLNLTPLAPTVSLDASVGRSAEHVLEMASHAATLDRSVGIAICGTPAFWSQGRPLDDFVGAIAQLRPQWVALSVFRPSLAYPPPTATREEVAGLCRTTDSLSRRSRVIVFNGDLVSLPAVAAGASAIGTGWDLRQRLLAPDAFRVATTEARAAQRITVEGLYAVLKRREIEQLERADRTRLLQLVPGEYPRTQAGQWAHHHAVMKRLTDRISNGRTARERTVALIESYRVAGTAFADVQPMARPDTTPAMWLTAPRLGLRDYAVSEGWLT
jgi:hypothetical protein